MNKNKINQSGRSMVEMLGVLAIIGVLSVAGVQGYTIAMNKHRANEILNEASKRAIVVASQIASGRTPTLAEFTDNEVGGAEFDQQVKNASGAVWSASDSQFKIGYVSGKEPSEAVQKQMENIAGTNGMIKSFEDGLTYNNDLGTGTEGDNEPEEVDCDVCHGTAEDKTCVPDPDNESVDCSSCIALSSTYHLDDGYWRKCIKKTECQYTYGTGITYMCIDDMPSESRCGAFGICG